MDLAGSDLSSCSFQSRQQCQRNDLIDQVDPVGLVFFGVGLHVQ